MRVRVRVKVACMKQFPPPATTTTATIAAGPGASKVGNCCFMVYDRVPQTFWLYEPAGEERWDGSVHAAPFAQAIGMHSHAHANGASTHAVTHCLHD